MRSLLFAPADDARKLAEARDSGADALIIDLEDAVATPAKEAARKTAAAFVAQTRQRPVRPQLIVRVNGLGSGLIDADLEAIIAAAPDAIMLPKSRNGADVQHLSVKIAVREAEHDLADGSTGIIPIVTETAAAFFGLSSYAGASARLRAMTWEAKNLAVSLGAHTHRLADGSYADPYRLARATMLIAARACAIAPIDAVFANFRDEAGLRAECEAAKRDGFTGKMSIHPAQVAIINEAFGPPQAALEPA